MKKLLLLVLAIWSIQVHAQSLSKDSLSKHVHYLASEELKGRGLGTEGKELAKAYILQHFKQAGLQPYKGSYEQNFDLRIKLAVVKATNVVGMVEGTDPALKSEIIVLGAHYDHLGYVPKSSTYYPGADDNASGVATIIELAKYFQQNKPKRTILFIAFDAEESGLIGSNHFVKELTKEERLSMKAMFSFDMVGMLQKNEGLTLKGVGHIKGGAELAEELAQGIQLKDLSASTEAYTDTEPFGTSGIPAIHVFTGLKSPYHKPEDKADLLDYDGMERIAKFSSRFVEALANHTEVGAVNVMKRLQKKPGAIMKPLRFAVLGELNTGKHLYQEEFYDAKSEVGFALGLRASYRLSRMYALDLGVHFDQNASRSDAGRFYRNSLMVPLDLKFGHLFYVNAGAYYKNHFNGKNGAEKLDFDSDFRKDEWGFQAGFGFEYSKYIFGVNYRGSFDSIMKNGPKISPSSSGFYLGYRF
ncbi:hypothetical protein GCM10022216_05540 [Sphingobacterium kyonggiense]|uniref:Peptidase M28 domain-containing protein n=1 Tax=Sphingobacterium kyonggiense TaxID=714075 RepID=A0ABP7YB01_9SPHI